LPTRTAPARNERQFRHRVERDVAWLFRLLPLCPKLKGLLVFGPVVRHDGSTESLAEFIHKSAPRRGFKLLPDGELRVGVPNEAGRSFFMHEVCASGRGTITGQVVENMNPFSQVAGPNLCNAQLTFVSADALNNPASVFRKSSKPNGFRITTSTGLPR
jgi:hypothetical protein